MLRLCGYENSLLIVLQVFTKYQILFISFIYDVNKKPKESLYFTIKKWDDQSITQSRMMFDCLSARLSQTKDLVTTETGSTIQGIYLMVLWWF